jgi:UDP-N-acetylmuramoylalanine--D-glutamate ligase
MSQVPALFHSEFCYKVRTCLPAPVAILGFGLEGKSSFAFLSKCGYQAHELVILDKNPTEIPPGAKYLFGEDYLNGLQEVRSCLRSAGLPPKFLSDFKGIQSSQVELFFELWDRPCVGITGTFGKGTTLGILSHILAKAQMEHRLGGNYGIPVLDLLLELRATDNPPLPLLELSSFQLMTLRKSPSIAVILETTSEHLDWHENVEEYRAAKSHLCSHQKQDDLCIYLGTSPGACEIAACSQAQMLSVVGTKDSWQVQDGVLTWEGGQIPIAACKVKGEHMLRNMSAAGAVAKALGVDNSTIQEACLDFPGLPLRLEFSGRLTIDGIQWSYYNDSYATRPEAALAAVQSFAEPLALILGGSEKHADFSAMCRGFKNHKALVHISLIGLTAERLCQELLAQGYDRSIQFADSLDAAIDQCELALPAGGIVLLSPACASFGMFSNYKHRGAVFHEKVAQRIQKGSQ